MPHYCHAKDDPPESGRAYASKALAHASKQPNETITFVLSDDERHEWRSRESSRLSSGEYQHVPWRYESWYSRQLYYDHYAHMSVAHVGLIAYTPSDEWGIADRQLRVTPGKYLAKFAQEANLPQAQIDEYCATVKALDGSFKLATTADEIEAVYTHGPDSCMSHRASSSNFWTHGVHPTRAYGDSDLAVAYLGTLDDVSSRCVVWPDRKIYTCVYGDTTLRHVLQAAGYEPGTLDGARIRVIAIDNGDGYIVPYIDGAEMANKRGAWFVLSTGDGEYCVRETSGVTNERETHYCAHCANECDEDETYCSSCADEVYYCAHCSEDRFDNDGISINNYGLVCESCADELRQTCANDDCGDTWFEVELSRADQRARWQAGTANLCVDCATTRRYCEHCEKYVSNDAACQSCLDNEDTDTDTAETPASDTAPLPLQEAIVPTTRDAGNNRSMTEALTGSYWTFAGPDARCRIWDCAQPIANGAMALHPSAPTTGYYCHHCAIDGRLDAYADLIPRLPSIPTPDMIESNRMEAAS